MATDAEDPPASDVAIWERSTVWGMLRNPAYKGQACFGKTTLAPRQRITRPIRMRGGIATRNSASHERPREDWMTIAVPPIVNEKPRAGQNGSRPTRLTRGGGPSRPASCKVS